MIILLAPTIVFVIMIVKDSELIGSPGIESAEVENGTIIRACQSSSRNLSVVSNLSMVCPRVPSIFGEPVTNGSLDPKYH